MIWNFGKILDPPHTSVKITSSCGSVWHVLYQVYDLVECNKFCLCIMYFNSFVSKIFKFFRLTQKGGLHEKIKKYINE